MGNANHGNNAAAAMAVVVATFGVALAFANCWNTIPKFSDLILTPYNLSDSPRTCSGGKGSSIVVLPFEEITLELPDACPFNYCVIPPSIAALRAHDHVLVWHDARFVWQVGTKDKIYYSYDEVVSTVRLNVYRKLLIIGFIVVVLESLIWVNRSKRT